MRRRASTAVVVGVLGAGAVALGPAVSAPASSGEDDIGLSYDGVHYQQSLQRPLFDPAIRWVPGDVRTARFWIRNEHPESGVMALDVERGSRAALVDSGWLTTSARSGDGPWTAVPDGDVSRLVDVDRLASGRPVPVEIRVSMGQAAPNGTMVLASGLDLHVVVSQYLPAHPSVPHGDLPNTGAPVPPWLPPIAVAALVLGGWLVRRRRPSPPPPPQEPLT